MIEGLEEFIEALKKLLAEHGNPVVLAMSDEGKTYCIDSVEYNDDEGPCILLNLEPEAR